MSAPLEDIARSGILPVVEIDDARKALPLADALIAAGLPLVEITLRTEAALDAIREIARRRPECRVGAGTVTRAGDASRAAEAGAEFLVSPGLTARLADGVRAAGLPFLPGVATASEIMLALEEGWSLVKYFPAEAQGGAAALRSLSAPFAVHGLRFLPTGGIRPETLGDYLAIPSVAAVGGSWIATPAHLAAGDYEGVARRARAARELFHARSQR